MQLLRSRLRWRNVEDPKSVIQDGLARILQHPPETLWVPERVPGQIHGAHNHGSSRATRLAELRISDPIDFRVHAAEIRKMNVLGGMLLLIFVQCDQAGSPINVAVGKQRPGLIRIHENVEV